MIKELHQNPQTFVTSEFFVKIAIRFFSLSETAKSFCRLFPRREYKLGSHAFRANLIQSDDSKPLFVYRHFHWCGVGFSIDAALPGVGVATIFPAAKTGRGKKCDLRVRGPIDWRSARSVPVTVLCLRHHFFDFRRRGGVSRALCRRVYRIARGRVRRHSDFLVPADRGSCLGVGQGLFAMGAVAAAVVKRVKRVTLFHAQS